jgi:tetratricopeptide (TPR) repeat protein
VKVFSRLQYQSQPANPQAVKAGALPEFPRTTYALADGPSTPENPVAAERIRLARQSESAGKIEAAIQNYQAALTADANNPVALDRLAWILSTSGQPELRDGKAAVQLAVKAVQLTEWRRPSMIVTLASAYAAASQFAKAVFAARFARDLAIITGQSDVVASSTKLISQCAGGPPTGALDGQ